MHTVEALPADHLRQALYTRETQLVPGRGMAAAIGLIAGTGIRS
jgi:hypothetical protein